MKAKSLKIIERGEIMKRIIDLDTMTCIGYFDEKNSDKVLSKYQKIYAWCAFDVDGDLTVSDDDDE